MDASDEPRKISQFEHENALMHYGNVNKRSMVMLLAVCVTFIIITLTFVIGYTIRDRNREEYWLMVIQAMTTTGVTEVEDGGAGIHQLQDP